MPHNDINIWKLLYEQTPLIIQYLLGVLTLGIFTLVGVIYKRTARELEHVEDRVGNRIDNTNERINNLERRIDNRLESMDNSLKQVVTLLASQSSQTDELVRTTQADEQHLQNIENSMKEDRDERRKNQKGK